MKLALYFLFAQKVKQKEHHKSQPKAFLGVQEFRGSASSVEIGEKSLLSLPKSLEPKP
jgi:hypothetical protein